VPLPEHPMPPPAPSPLRILIVDDEQGIRRTMSLCLEAEGHQVTAVGNIPDAIGEAKRLAFDLAYVDLRLGVDSGLDLIPALLADSPWIKVVVITAYATVDTAVEAMRRGAADYLPKPFTPGQLIAATSKIVQLRTLEHRLDTLQAGQREGADDVDLASAAPAMQRAAALARDVAASDASVLIRGENGTGKGVLARAIHHWSARAAKSMAVISCPSLSPELLESELFGHVRGAFTGAVRDHPGRIATTDGGTLFLDEIGDLPIQIQPKLLRFLQDREYERVGDAITRKADVRLITATNVDLDSAVGSGRFRQDLLYRLNVIQIDLPPLRQRTEDISALAVRLLAGFKGGKHIVGFTAEAEQALRTYAWPGNVRELRNVVERATILCRCELIGIEHLPTGFAPAVPTCDLGDLVSLDLIEEQHIRRVLAKVPTLEEAAKVLGIDYATLWRRRKKYGL
jgi:NtrC-family two-component system response regulator AlgB